MSGRGHKPRNEPFATVTHARLRLGQGDAAGARRILDAVLTRDPDHHEARDLLNEMASRKRAGVLRGSSEVGDPEIQARRFRRALGRQKDHRRVIERLGDWLKRIKRDTGDVHA